MREAAIQSQRGAPRKRSAPAKKGSTGGAIASAGVLLLRRSMGLLRRHPGKALAILACTGLGGAIVGNAVLNQSGRHPAPLFGRPTPPTAAMQPMAGSMPALSPRVVYPAPRMTSAAQPPRPAATPAPDLSGDQPEPKSTPAKSPGAHKDDAIAHLLHGEPSAVSALEADPKVAAAQRALAKLGFAVKPDGRMGPSTKQALEKFERDHHLATSGELSPKLLRELGIAAALPPG